MSHLNRFSSFTDQSIMLDVIDCLQEQFRNKCTQEESGHSIEATKSKCQDCNHQASRKSNQHSIVKTKHILISPFESFRFKFPATELFKHSGSNDKGIDVFTSFGRGRVFLQTDVFCDVRRRVRLRTYNPKKMQASNSRRTCQICSAYDASIHDQGPFQGCQSVVWFGTR